MVERIPDFTEHERHGVIRIPLQRRLRRVGVHGRAVRVLAEAVTWVRR